MIKKSKEKTTNSDIGKYDNPLITKYHPLYKIDAIDLLVPWKNHLIDALPAFDGSKLKKNNNKYPIKYLKTRATNIGIYILGSSAISPEGISSANQPRIFSEKDLPSLSERAQIIKSQGALALVQINHRGLLACKESGLPVVAPSAEIATKLLQERNIPFNSVHELTNEEIETIISKETN